MRELGENMQGPMDKPPLNFEKCKMLVVITYADGRQWVMEVPAEGQIVQSMALTINGNPIVRVPFNMHGKSLHTMCSRDDDSIRDVEW